MTQISFIDTYLPNKYSNLQRVITVTASVYADVTWILRSWWSEVKTTDCIELSCSSRRFFSSTAKYMCSLDVRSSFSNYKTAYHLTFERLHHHSTRLRNIWNPTSFNCLSPACRACDYVYTDYARRSRSSSCRLLRPINCRTYITLQISSISWLFILTNVSLSA